MLATTEQLQMVFSSGNWHKDWFRRRMPSMLFWTTIIRGKLKLTDADFSRLEKLIKLLTPLKQPSDFLGGDKYVTGSCVMRGVGYKL
jgi:hypothetical protein